MVTGPPKPVLRRMERTVMAYTINSQLVDLVARDGVGVDGQFRAMCQDRPVSVAVRAANSIKTETGF